MSSQKVSNQTETVEPESEHPIDIDIVRAAANDCAVDPDVLNEVLAACSRLWDPHRDKLLIVLEAFHMYDQHSLFIQAKPDHRVVISGTSLTPSKIVQRVDLYALVETENVTPVGMTLAVSAAHAMQAERLFGSPLENSLVIRIR